MPTLICKVYQDSSVKHLMRIPSAGVLPGGRSHSFLQRP